MIHPQYVFHQKSIKVLNVKDILKIIGRMLEPELCEIAVLRTEDSVLHPLAMLALEVAEAPAKQIVLIVKAVAATLIKSEMD